MSIVGVTTCPDCGGELKPTDSTDDRPIQLLTQGCVSCSFQTVIGLLWYPRGGYELVADVSSVDESDKGDCEKSDGVATTVIIPRQEESPYYYSETHTRHHHQAVLDALGD